MFMLFWNGIKVRPVLNCGGCNSLFAMILRIAPRMSKRDGWTYGLVFSSGGVTGDAESRPTLKIG
jgi:hypothetical protein